MSDSIDGAASSKESQRGLGLQRGTIHIWHYDLAAPCDDALLSADEHARAKRLIIPEKRRRFIAARAGLRHILSRYTGISPECLNFTYGEHGKPALYGESLEFNLSHVEETALLGVALSPLGIDVERIKPVPDMIPIAQIAFSPAEQEALRHTPQEQQTLAFFRTWTRKEAVMKGRGEGFRLARSFTIPVTALTDTIVVEGWTICDVPVQPGFIASVAVKQQSIPVQVVMATV